MVPNGCRELRAEDLGLKGLRASRLREVDVGRASAFRAYGLEVAGCLRHVYLVLRLISDNGREEEEEEEALQNATTPPRNSVGRS